MNTFAIFHHNDECVIFSETLNILHNVGMLEFLEESDLWSIWFAVPLYENHPIPFTSNWSIEFSLLHTYVSHWWTSRDVRNLVYLENNTIAASADQFVFCILIRILSHMIIIYVLRIQLITYCLVGTK